MAYQPVAGQNFPPEGISDEDSMTQMLHWIGITERTHLATIIADCFADSCSVDGYRKQECVIAYSWWWRQ
jgi:hypothetical protein